MTETIAERLRDMHGGVPESYVGKLRVEAADEIERLQRENDALYDMMQGMKINLTKILDGRGALEPRP